MSAATQVYSRDFDTAFLKLPADLRARIEAKIDELGSRLFSYPHVRLTGLDCYRVRIGDYRVAYDFDANHGFIFLLAVGHRGEVYRTWPTLTADGRSRTSRFKLRPRRAFPRRRGAAYRAPDLHSRFTT